MQTVETNGFISSTKWSVVKNMRSVYQTNNHDQNKFGIDIQHGSLVNKWKNSDSMIIWITVVINFCSPNVSVDMTILVCFGIGYHMMVLLWINWCIFNATNWFWMKPSYSIVLISILNRFVLSHTKLWYKFGYMFVLVSINTNLCNQ